MGSALFGAPHYAGSLKESSGGQMGTNKKRGGSVGWVRIQILSGKMSPLSVGYIAGRPNSPDTEFGDLAPLRGCSLFITKDPQLRI